MAVSLSVIAAKDSAGTAIAGGLQAQDKSGTGAGPFTLGQVLIDGLAGVNMAAVTATNAVKVDGSAVTQPVSIATAPVLVAGSAIIGKVTTDQTTHGTTDKVAADLYVGGAAVDKGSGTGGSATPRVIIDTASPGIIPATTNLHFFSVAGTPAAVAIKASAGTLYGLQAVNTSAAPIYLKLYNAAFGSVTVGTTVPLMTIPVPTTATTGAGIAPYLPVAGITFSTAMSYTFTNLAADNDATAVAVGTTLNVQFA